MVKDSINYLDHINGKKHQRNWGMSMRVKRSTLGDVKDRFSKHQATAEAKAAEGEYSLEERMKVIAEEEEKMRAYRKERKKEKKRKNEDEDLPIDEDVAAAMGFGGFGAKRAR